MKALEDLKEILEDELKKITKKGDITPTELENAYKATDILKDIETIKAMEKQSKEDDQYSQRQGERSYNYSQNSYMHPYSMADGNMGNQSQQNQGGYSGTPMSYAYDNMSRAGGSYENYSQEQSYRRGRDARTGRYVSRDNRSYDASYEGGSYDGGSYNDSYDDRSYARGRGRYSRHDAKEKMMMKLEDMMRTVTSEKDRMAIQRCMDQLED